MSKGYKTSSNFLDLIFFVVLVAICHLLDLADDTATTDGNARPL